MRYSSFLVLLSIGSMIPAAQAQQLELALSQETADASLLVNNFDFGLFFNEDDDIALDAGLLVTGVPAGETPLTFGLGAKIYAVDIDDPSEDVYALAIGGEAKYTIPANTPMAVSAGLFYSPEVTTSSDADNLLDFTTRFEIELVPQTSAFIGYRFFEVDLEDGGDHELDENVHLGVRLRF